ncbi:hypothetical protein V6R98_17980 [Agrobacterium sp. CCNWLW71]|jgi:hypothetical protein|uniref:Transcriptional regulator n=1 Tax=Agrobacterium tumefaciens TaxID=358 RepID=A0AAW8M1M4_AGRTU|nr:hypothetical protein [Agrobacterium tumefaciens]MBP2568293.1 hypothetical protein [Agrobacterium tumefaciens]MDR6705029.1 hypothetical protein [Agrobacterium tumefaciens]
MAATKEAFFKPGKLSAQDKASLTDSAAKQIINAEAAQRARKTERLRQLREAQEATIITDTPVSAKKRSSKK